MTIGDDVVAAADGEFQDLPTDAGTYPVLGKVDFKADAPGADQSIFTFVVRRRIAVVSGS
jgi:hypothetical protein